MTIRELYEIAKAEGKEDYKIIIFDEIESEWWDASNEPIFYDKQKEVEL